MLHSQLTSTAAMYVLEKRGGQNSFEMKTLSYFMVWVQRNWMQNISNSVTYLQCIPWKYKMFISVKSQDVLLLLHICCLCQLDLIQPLEFWVTKNHYFYDKYACRYHKLVVRLTYILINKKYWRCEPVFWYSEFWDLHNVNCAFSVDLSSWQSKPLSWFN